jgi:biotin synthase
MRTEEVMALFELPFSDLVFRAQSIHRQHFDPAAVQLSTLLSVKTGGCPEDCAYCPQSRRYNTGVEDEEILGLQEVLEHARAAKANGATRFCMGAAWRDLKDRDLPKVAAMISGVKALGMETCATLGMLSADQATALREAGLDYYNHNLDTSPEFYGEIISTRTYQDRLDTLEQVRRAGISVCSGGIIGLGESVDDRCRMLITLANQAEHPESVPVNALVAVEGTPLQKQKQVEPLELVRMIATARVLMPKAMVRLSAGRLSMSNEAQLLCMLAGANSIFFGEKLLTTGNPEYREDMALLTQAGISPLAPA